VDAVGKLHTIPCLDVTEAQRTLGVRLTPDGNSMAELNYLHVTALEWKQKMERAHLTHTDALFSLRSSILRKLAYPLAVTTFTEQQCAEVMKPILGAGLPKIGCIHSMPRAIVHGPLEQAGLNIPNLYAEQALTQLVMLLGHGHSCSSQMGILLRALAESMQLETGLAIEPFQTPKIFESLITNTWLKRLWLDCLRYQIDIQTDLPIAQPNRGQDVELMRAFASYGYRGQELRELNCCRMSLHAIWLSDICDGTGTKVLVDCWKGSGPVESNYRWPPTFTQQSYWHTWQQALTKSFGLDRWQRPSRPLGKWLPSDNGWFYEDLTDRLWCHNSTGWRYHSYIPLHSRTKYFHDTASNSNGNPSRARLQRAVVLHRNHWLLLAGYDTVTAKPQLYRGLDALHHCPLASDWNLKLKTVGSLSDLIEDIRNGYGYIVSDGSYHSDAGAAAWIIEGRSAVSWIIGTMITPGHHTDHSSF